MASATDVEEKAEQSKLRRQRNILLGVTGSVAAVKGPEVASKLARNFNANVRVVLTEGGENFWEKAAGYNQLYWSEILSLMEKDQDIPASVDVTQTPSISIVDSDDDWKGWNALGDPVLHIELRDWADILVIAPLSAHTLAKLSNGLCDDTLSCIVRAWDFGQGTGRGRPLVLAPAMNTSMWQHPLTMTQLETIKQFWNDNGGCGRKSGVVVVPPQIKRLACGEHGIGALAAVEDIVSSVEDVIREQS